jgi:hypothetical protein
MFPCPRWIPVAVLACAAVMVVAALSAAGTVPTETAPSDSAAVEITPEMAAAAMAPSSALDREVATIRDTFRQRLAELTAHYGTAPNAEAAAAAQHEIAALKLQLELDLLGVQLRLARERDDSAAITELEQSLTAARVRLVADTGLAAPAATAGSAKR